MNKWIVIFGNPINGLSFFGPFLTELEAENWADQIDITAEYWIASLTSSEFLQVPEATTLGERQ